MIGSWLSGPSAALSGAGDEPGDDRPQWRGQRLGLPESGTGSAAPPGRRAVGFAVDVVLSALIAGMFTYPQLPQGWSWVVWFVITVLPVSVFGFTPGMAVARVWVARVDGTALVGVPRALLRCALTALLVPAVLWNLDGRSWHDRLSGTVVLRR